MCTSLLKNILIVGRYAFLIILIQCFSAIVLFAHKGTAQNTDQVYVSVDWHNVHLKKALASLETKTQYSFFYKDKSIEGIQNITLTASNQTLKQVLIELSRQKKIRFKRLNNVISVIKINKPGKQPAVEEVNTLKVLTGKITDEKGEGLPGVNIVVEGTSTATITDVDGNFSLDVSEDAKVLIISYVGYLTEKISIEDQTTFNVAMVPDLQQLQEIIIQAYRTTTNDKNNASLSIVSSETIENRPNASVVQTLQAQVPGLLIGTGTGQPGANSSVVLRGYGTISGEFEPLFVVDDVPVDPDDFRGLNPNDIANVSVLKDAAALAAYGNRGANGVILITTKKGTYNSGLGITYSGSYGNSFQQENNYGLMNSRDLLNLQKKLGVGTGSELTDAEINVLANQNNTDWTDFILQTGQTFNNQLGINFGGKNGAIYTSFSHTKQEGIARETSLERYTFRNNIIGKSNDGRFDYGVNLTAAFVESEFATDLGSGLVFFNPLVGALWGQPYLNPYRLDGTINDDSFDEFQPLSASPYVILNNFRFNSNIDKQVKSIASFYGNFEIIEGLTLSGKFGIDYQQEDEVRVIHPESTNRLFYPNGGQIQGRQIENFRRNVSLNSTVSLNYTKSFGKHSLDASVFTETFRFYTKSNGFTTLGLDPKAFSPGDGDGFTDGNRQENGNFLYIPSVRSNLGEGGLFSYFTIIDYDYDERFGFTATVRRDASFRFANTNRWGTFYSVSARWNLDKEEFIQSISFIEKLKLRASYGSTGSERIGGSGAFLDAATASRTLYQLGTGYNNTSGYFINRPGNDDLKWETVFQSNIGIDFGLFGNKLRGTVDVYNKTTEDLFLGQPISAVNGSFNINANQGSIRNRGIEFSMEYDVYKRNDLNVTLRGNFSYNENEVLSLPNGDIDNGATIIREGHPLNSYFLVPYVGVNPANGNALYRKRNGELTEIYNPNDRIIMASAIPKYQGGFGGEINYKGFFVSAHFSFLAGVQRYNDQLRFFSQNPFEAINFNVSSDYNRAWTPENRITDVEGLFSTRANFGSDKFLHESSYLRLRYISVGYNIPSSILEKIRLKSARVYVQGENLYTWTKWIGLDVEADINRRFDFSDYPTPRQITVGLDLKF